MSAMALTSVCLKRMLLIRHWAILCMHLRSEMKLTVSPSHLIPIWQAKHSLGWPGGQRRPSTYTIQSYATQWNQYATAISQNLTGVDAMRLFQGCAFEAPRHYGNITYWNVQNAELDGMHSDKAKTVSDHEVSPMLNYFWISC